MQTNSTLNDFDFWSIIHFAGCAMLAVLFADVGLWAGFTPSGNFFFAFWVAWILGLIWEGLDEWYSNYLKDISLSYIQIEIVGYRKFTHTTLRIPLEKKFKPLNLNNIFDPRGGSYLDLACDIAGALVGSGANYFITILVRG